MTVPQKTLLRKFLVSTVLSSFVMMMVQFILPDEYSLVRSGWYVLAIIVMALLIFQFYFGRLVGFETKRKFKYAGTVFPALVLIVALIALPGIAVNFVDVATRFIPIYNTPGDLNQSAGEYAKFKSIIPILDKSEQEVYFWQSKEGKYSNHDQEHAEVTYYIPLDDSLHRFWIKWRFETRSSYDLTGEQIEKFRNDFLKASGEQMPGIMDSVNYFTLEQVPYSKLPDKRHKSQQGEVTLLIPNFEAPANEAKDYLGFLAGMELILFLLFLLSIINLKKTNDPTAHVESPGRT